MLVSTLSPPPPCRHVPATLPPRTSAYFPTTSLLTNTNQAPTFPSRRRPSRFTLYSGFKVIERVNRVLTEPTGLESTSLVLALGLDIFGCRVAPSKTYDMLDPNFNYALLVLVLGAMTTAVLVASRLAANKRLKEQWA